MTNINANQPRIERVDDIPLLYGMLERMGIQAIVDSLIQPHGNWAGMSPGWVITIWLIHILSAKNHQMEVVQQWVHRHLFILSKLSGQGVRELDFSDDRLAMCLRELSPVEVWQELEQRLGVRLIRVYDLKGNLIRLDATTGTVHHEAGKQSLFQVGKAKNGLYETQFKLMLASLDELGLPLVVDVKPGNCADDPLYIPSYERAKQILQRDGLLIVGDCKMDALLTRGTIVAGQDGYLTPLAGPKDESALLGQLLHTWLEEGAAATLIFMPEDVPTDGGKPDPKLAIACGFEVTRRQEVQVDGQKVAWDERLLVVRSYSYMKSMLAGFRRRLEKAEAALNALTPPPRRGKTQIEDETQLLWAIGEIEKKYRVQGFFHYDYQQEVKERRVGAYRGNPPRLERKIRYQLTVQRQPPAIEAAEFEIGWRIYATSFPSERLSLAEAVLAYRNQITQENVFRRLHGKMLSITPLYIQREDHARGLIHLLTLAARTLALGDYLAREALAKEKTELADVYAGNPNRSTARPTMERMLTAFEGINLIIVAQGEPTSTLLSPSEQSPTLLLHDAQVATLLTDLRPVHRRILALLDLPASLLACLQSA